MVSNKKLNASMLVMAVVLNAFLGYIYFSYGPEILAAATTTEVTFILNGTHAEDTTSQVLEAVGYNTTVFEPLGNGSILVTAVPIDR